MPYPEPSSSLDERPSKTAQKKQAHELQALGESLVALPDDRLAELPMSDTLLDALRTARNTRSHEGRRRQMQYVGKLMRGADIEPLREAVAASRLPSARDTLNLHRIERWRTELVAEGDAVTRWLAAYPQCDAPKLRSLIRSAQKDALLPPEQRHGRAWRELFQFIKPHLNDDDSA